MPELRKISLCITTWNRVEMTVHSFLDVINDERISEIVISDDASDMEVFKELKSITDIFPKIKLHRNLTNQDCYRNKYTTISLAKEDYCIILDSDNKIDKKYIDKIYEQEWDEETLLAPSWAMPNFDYREYSGVILDKGNINHYLPLNMLETCLNTMNYFVNKNKYLEVWDGSIDPVTSDSLFQNYNWIKNGYKIHILEGLWYSHLVHSGSHYQNNVVRTGDFHQKLLQKIRDLDKEMVI